MPTAKQYEQAVSYMVGQLHVSLSDAEVKAHVCSKFKKGLSKQTIAAACRAAVRVHAKNKKLYQDVMGGRFNPLTPREADPMWTAQARMQGHLERAERSLDDMSLAVSKVTKSNPGHLPGDESLLFETPRHVVTIKKTGISGYVLPKGRGRSTSWIYYDHKDSLGFDWPETVPLSVRQRIWKTVRATRRPNQADRLGNPMLTRAAANQILDGVYGNFDQALHFAKSQAGPFWRQVEVELHQLAEETARPLVRGVKARRATVRLNSSAQQAQPPAGTMAYQLLEQTGGDHQQALHVASGQKGTYWRQVENALRRQASSDDARLQMMWATNPLTMKEADATLNHALGHYKEAQKTDSPLHKGFELGQARGHAHTVVQHGPQRAWSAAQGLMSAAEERDAPWRQNPGTPRGHRVATCRCFACKKARNA